MLTRLLASSLVDSSTPTKGALYVPALAEAVSFVTTSVPIEGTPKLDSVSPQWASTPLFIVSLPLTPRNLTDKMLCAPAPTDAVMMLTVCCACNRQHTLTRVRSQTAMGCSEGARAGS